MLPFFRRKTRQGDFWAWLQENTDRIKRNGGEISPRVLRELSEAFASSYPDLVWEVGPRDEDCWEFCVSADGDPNLVDKVYSAIEDAPELDGWVVLPFRQRGPLTVEVGFGDASMGYDDLWCRVKADGHRAKVKVLIRGLTEENSEQLLGASLILLDNAIGEEDSLTMLSHLSNGPLPDNPQRTDSCFPLAELPAWLDRLKESD
ncbi:MAG: hypothetical protein KDA80_03870 [Planctomycetaceae bacterium]|nr:hypothetical protein [Planctomycetaceae bacterium]